MKLLPITSGTRSANPSDSCEDACRPLKVSHVTFAKSLNAFMTKEQEVSSDLLNLPVCLLLK